MPEDLAPAPTTSLLSLSVITQPARQLLEGKPGPCVLSRHDHNNSCSGGFTGSNADLNRIFSTNYAEGILGHADSEIAHESDETVSFTNRVSRQYCHNTRLFEVGRGLDCDSGPS